MIVAPFFVSLLVSFFCVPLLIPRLRRAGISGSDIHKSSQPRVSEMGGLAIVVGFGAGPMEYFHLYYSIGQGFYLPRPWSHGLHLALGSLPG